METYIWLIAIIISALLNITVTIIFSKRRKPKNLAGYIYRVTHTKSEKKELFFKPTNLAADFDDISKVKSAIVVIENVNIDD